MSLWELDIEGVIIFDISKGLKFGFHLLPLYPALIDPLNVDAMWRPGDNVAIRRLQIAS